AQAPTRFRRAAAFRGSRGCSKGPPMSQRLYLDDLHVGQRFTSEPRQVTAEEIKAFAAEFDPQPFHLDEDAAKRSLFKGLAASGWHTAAMSMRMLVDSVPLADGLVGAELQLAWPKPTRPGMTLQLSSEV